MVGKSHLSGKSVGANSVSIPTPPSSKFIEGQKCIRKIPFVFVGLKSIQKFQEKTKFTLPTLPLTR